MEDVVEGVRRAIEDGDQTYLKAALHPYLHWIQPGVRLRGRVNVLEFLASTRSAPPPESIELREGQVYRWTVA